MDSTSSGKLSVMDWWEAGSPSGLGGAGGEAGRRAAGGGVSGSCVRELPASGFSGSWSVLSSFGPRRTAVTEIDGPESSNRLDKSMEPSGCSMSIMEAGLPFGLDSGRAGTEKKLASGGGAGIDGMPLLIRHKVELRLRLHLSGRADRIRPTTWAVQEFVR